MKRDKNHTPSSLIFLSVTFLKGRAHEELEARELHQDQEEM